MFPNTTSHTQQTFLCACHRNNAADLLHETVGIVVMTDMMRKRAVERRRVKNIGEEYNSISELLGLRTKKTNKVLTLKTAVQFVRDHIEGLDSTLPLVLYHSFMVVQ